MASPSNPDPYWKLRPAPSTPEDEVCHCATIQSVILRDSLGDNPIYCIACNGEIMPERIGFDSKFAEDIAHWRSLHRALYHLWLDASEYEEWAVEKLTDPISRVNLLGRDLVKRLNEIVASCYWWFCDESAADYVQPTHCLICHGEIAQYENRNFSVCFPCRVLY